MSQDGEGRTWWQQPQFAIALLWLGFLLRGTFYCLSLPVWEGFDEPYQFAAIQHVATTGTMATPSTPVSRQVGSSLYLLPAPWMIRQHQLPAPVLSEEQYWQLSPEERQRMRSELLALPARWAAEPSSPAIENYEGQQAPLYYFLAAPLLRSFAGASLPTQALLLRLFGLLLASAAIPIGYQVALRALRKTTLAILAVALAVALPELLVNVCRVSNEPPALLLSTSLLLLSVTFVQSEHPERCLPAVAAALGVALLTKAYFLTFVPAVGLVILLKLRNCERRARLLVSAAASVALLMLIAAPWYWHVRSMSGSWSGQTDDSALGHMSRVALLGQIFHVSWKSGFASIVLSHVWFGGWSFLRLPNWIYACVFLLAVVAVTGMVLYLLRWWKAGAHADAGVAIAAFYICFWLGLGYHVLVTYVHLGVSASTGWYLYCLVFGEAVLVVAGFAQIEGSLRLRWVLPTIITGFALIDLYGMHSLMLPYYSGLVAHTGDRVRSLSLFRFAPGEIFARLSSVAAIWLSAGLLEFSWVLYVAATLGNVALGWKVSRDIAHE